MSNPSHVWGNFWQILNISEKLLNDFEKISPEVEYLKRLPQIETAYIDSIIVHVAKIFSSSRNEPFRLQQFKSICRSEVREELDNLENRYKDIIGKIVTNRNKLIAHLDEKFYELCYSESEIVQIASDMAQRAHMSLEDAKAVCASMPRAVEKTQERYSVGDFRSDLPQINKMIEELNSIWSKSLPLVES